MATRRYLLIVRGKQHEWIFNVEFDPQYVDEVRDDGLVVHESFNSIPMWIAQAGLVHPWCFIQDVFHLRNPWQKGRQ